MFITGCLKLKKTQSWLNHNIDIMIWIILILLLVIIVVARSNRPKKPEMSPFDYSKDAKVIEIKNEDEKTLPEKDNRFGDLTFTAFDVETANSTEEGICQIGIVKVENGIITERVKYLVQPPGNVYGQINISKHGISAKKTENKPTFDLIFPLIAHFFEGQKVVSHNEDFDIRVLKKNLDFYNIEHPVFQKTECTFKITGIGLVKACQAYSVETGLHHDALEDAEMCANLYMKIKLGHKRDDSLIFREKASESPSTADDFIEKADKNIFKDKNVVITGKFATYSREDMKHIVERLGGIMRTIVSSKTDIVIVGMEAGPAKIAKIEEQQKLRDNLLVMFEQDLLDLTE